MIQCPARLPIPYVRIHSGYDLSGSSFNTYSLAVGFILQTNRLNPDLNQNDFDSQVWTKLAGSQVIFHTIKSSTDPIHLEGMFENISMIIYHCTCPRNSRFLKYAKLNLNVDGWHGWRKAPMPRIWMLVTRL